LTVDALLAAARRRLLASPLGLPVREAGSLLAHLLGWSEAQLLARGERGVPAGLVAAFEALLDRRLAGEPIAYLKGCREFYGRDFAVDARVLIPRPETEHLVEAALALPLPSSARVLDVGTGSGILALTLAAERPSWRLTASDLSLGALEVARANARRLGLAERVSWLLANLTEPLDLAAFDLVVSNPPYVPLRDAAALSIEVRGFEPSLALFGEGPAGVGCYERLLVAGARQRAGTFQAWEIGDGQLPILLPLVARSALGLHAVHEDYAGKARVVVLKRT
jgi:release factor glutamine methyltransferase